MAWFSEHDFPEGTLVEHNDVRYRVTGKQSYKDYSNVIQYELKTEEALNGNTDASVLPFNASSVFNSYWMTFE